MPPRPRYAMPEFFREALEAHTLMDAYRARPPYQQNDYIGWITRAKLDATRQKRLKQMLGELKQGDVYLYEDEVEAEIKVTVTSGGDSHFFAQVEERLLGG